MADPKDAPVGSGAAKLAMSKIEAMKLYNQAQIEAQSNGDTLPPFTEWFANQQQASSANGALATAGSDQK